MRWAIPVNPTIYPSNDRTQVDPAPFGIDPHPESPKSHLRFSLRSKPECWLRRGLLLRTCGVA
ncbi:hypothetical protein M7I_8013 [Glarea lozoyensis 74030]|uniref:Uncharacterized protein n=1 Tax=Glarea lozoyensis (strain ATCC 74030 / MF5533) TaxID=1104152 RepID=H0EYV3_GLAL7|nr:hypothetical protein M7I_8013 [Glarea lozoyensis 74030]